MTFLNEITTLEIRLEELYDQVDHFVIVEGELGFSGFEKPLQFPHYEQRLAKYMDKIIYLPIQEATRQIHKDGKVLNIGVQYANAWARGNAHKNSVCLALTECTPDDIIVFSDVDEIPSRDAFTLMLDSLRNDEIVLFNQKLYRGYYNRRCVRDPIWTGTIAMRYKVLQQLSPNNPNAIRTDVCFGSLRSYNAECINVRTIDGGWHFSSVGNFNQYIAKMDNWEHFENPCPRTEAARRAEIVYNHILESVDSTFPIYVQNNELLMLENGLLDDNQLLADGTVCQNPNY